MSRDRVFVFGMQFFGRHGVLPEEQAQGQWFVVDVEVETSAARAARRDNPTAAVDYRDIHAAARGVVEGPPARLVETLAEAIARRVLRLKGAAAVTVRVRKPNAPLPGPVEAAGVEIRRRARRRR
jgi:dihydroneopterin aldolase